MTSNKSNDVSAFSVPQAINDSMTEYDLHMNVLPNGSVVWQDFRWQTPSSRLLFPLIEMLIVVLYICITLVSLVQVLLLPLRQSLLNT